MTTNIDDLYPHLSALARSQGKTLSRCGKVARNRHINYLRLSDCCWFILNKGPRFRSGDYYNYLATLDEFVRIFPSQNESSKLWKKIKAPHSKFLDTVVEAAWAIYFKGKGYMVRLEVLLPGSGNDADFMVTIHGKRWWLDAFSIGVKKLGPPDKITERCRRGVDAVVSELATKARGKYDDKFKKSVRSGLFDASARVGVLVCVLKRTQSIILPQFMDSKEVQTPTGLFDNEYPGLDLVWVHSLEPRVGSEILEPSTVCNWKWRRNDQEEI